ncbi:hypothetical protein CHS0354_035523 [Potamilus streckersoni]|uniref:Uncharacterized protein n=1 Tax=Potamilus streckersoni TaxID=2493646 RepID=A0AAE0RSI5_9BIVA|nr:hypothetical protein CHS0354_035523 [Potamilus streckersoni]
MCNRRMSTFSVFVGVIALVLFIVGIATPYMGIKTSDNVNTGMYQSCTQYNRTCYDTYTYFAKFGTEKTRIIISAVMAAFTVVGMIIFLGMALFYLCGLFEENSLAVLAVVVSFSTGVIGLASLILHGVTLTSLSYTLSWSFGIAITGDIIQIIAGIFMLLGKMAPKDLSV